MRDGGDYFAWKIFYFNLSPNPGLMPGPLYSESKNIHPGQGWGDIETKCPELRISAMVSKNEGADASITR